MRVCVETRGRIRDFELVEKSPSELIIEESEASTVRHLFDRYLELQSVRALADRTVGVLNNG